jgi:cytochrome c oxidase cbb3-type subunit 1
MAVNPKKLRPYDQPRKVRQPIIPDGPDAAATLYLVAAAIWLTMATGIGLLWVAAQLFPTQLAFSLEVPMLSGTLHLALNPATVSSGFWNAIVYGWLGNAGLGAIFFITPRILGRRLVGEQTATASAALWNVGLLAGLATLYAPQLAVSGFLAEFPLPVDAVLLLALVVANDAFWRTLLSARDSAPYVSVWYFGVALAAFAGLYALATIAPILSLPAAGAALANAFYVRAIDMLWVTGVALGTLYYLVPRATGNPLASTGLATFGWIAWVALGTLSTLGALVDTSIPFAVTQLGNAATLMLVVPAFLAVANLVLTVRGRWTMLLSSGTVPLAVLGLTFLTATAMLESIGGLRSVRSLVDGTEWVVGVRLLLYFGVATFAFLALADHAFPRLLRRDWGATVLGDVTLWAVFAGAALSGLALIGGGIAHGSMLADAASADAVSGTLIWFWGAAGAGIGLVALGGLASLVNVFLMYTSGPLAEYVVPPAPAASPSDAAPAAVAG